MVKRLTLLVGTISNSQVFLLKKASSFCKCKSYSLFFSKNISVYATFNDQSFNDTLTNDIVSFEQLGPGTEETVKLLKSHATTKTYLYNFDPLKPHFYIVKLGFTRVYIIFLISAQNTECEYSLEPPRRGGSNKYPQSMFWAEIWKIPEFFIWRFLVFGGEIFYIFE